MAIVRNTTTRKGAPSVVFGREAIDAAWENERTAQQFRDDLVGDVRELADRARMFVLGPSFVMLSFNETIRLAAEYAIKLDRAARTAPKEPETMQEPGAWSWFDPDMGETLYTGTKKYADEAAALGSKVTAYYPHHAPPAGVKVDAVMEIIDAWMEGYDFVGTGSSAAANAVRKEWEKDRARILSALGQGELK